MENNGRKRGESVKKKSRRGDFSFLYWPLLPRSTDIVCGPQ